MRRNARQYWVTGKKKAAPKGGFFVIAAVEA